LKETAKKMLLNQAQAHHLRLLVGTKWSKLNILDGNLGQQVKNISPRKSLTTPMQCIWNSESLFVVSLLAFALDLDEQTNNMNF
jgi:hypothetical protein